MIHLTLSSPTTIRVSPTTARHGAELKTIFGATYNGDRSWTLPLNAIGGAIRALGAQNVSIDYEALVARDRQLVRVVAQYRACGVRIWNDGGRLATDNETLTKALQPIAALLLAFVPTEPGERKAQREVPRVAVEEAEDDPELQLFLWGQDARN